MQRCLLKMANQLLQLVSKKEGKGEEPELWGGGMNELQSREINFLCCSCSQKRQKMNKEIKSNKMPRQNKKTFSDLLSHRRMKQTLFFNSTSSSKFCHIHQWDRKSVV